MEPEVIAAVIGAAGTVIVAIGLQVTNAQERRHADKQRADERATDREAEATERQQTRREEFLFRAMEHFGGGAQERSVGIAIAEAYWRRVPEQIDVVAPVLVNQLVYLLVAVDMEKSQHREHERMNLRRIVDLLEQIGRFREFANSYAPALRIIEGERKPGRGLDLSTDDELRTHIAAFLVAVKRELAAVPGGPRLSGSSWNFETAIL